MLYYVFSFECNHSIILWPVILFEREKSSIIVKMAQHFYKVCHCNLTTSTPRICVKLKYSIHTMLPICV